MQIPKFVYVGKFRKDGKTAMTANPKTAKAWEKDGHDIFVYSPTGEAVINTLNKEEKAFWDRVFISVLEMLIIQPSAAKHETDTVCDFAATIATHALERRAVELGPRYRNAN